MYLAEVLGTPDSEMKGSRSHDNSESSTPVPQPPHHFSKLGSLRSRPCNKNLKPETLAPQGFPVSTFSEMSRGERIFSGQGMFPYPTRLSPSSHLVMVIKRKIFRFFLFL